MPTTSPFSKTNSSKSATTKVPKFLHALYTMLQAEDKTVLAWSHDGTHFQVLDVARLEKEILPKYFNHSKLTSFQRQLNNFGFHKWTKTRANLCTFSHDVLVQHHPSRLSELMEPFEASKVTPTATTAMIKTATPTLKRQRCEVPASINGGQYVKTAKKVKTLAPRNFECFDIDINVGNLGPHETLESGEWAFDSIEISDLCTLDWAQGMSDAATDLILEPLLNELECEPLEWELTPECFAVLDKDFAVSTTSLEVAL